MNIIFSAFVGCFAGSMFGFLLVHFLIRMGENKMHSAFERAKEKESYDL